MAERRARECEAEMSSLIPVIPQEELENVRLVATSCGFGLKAIFRPQDEEISLKLLNGIHNTGNELCELLKDVARARCIQSERVQQVIGFYQSQRLHGFLTKWMPSGSLHALIHQRDIYPELPLCLITRILSDVAEGLCHLHNLSPPLFHQALKPSNILLDSLYRAQISDYGLTSWRKQQLSAVSLSANNLVYLSPEALRGEDPTAAGDIYSFGMTCWEAFSRKKPFEGKATSLKLLTGVSSGLRPRTDEDTLAIPSTAPQRNSLVQLIHLCWHSDPGTRPAIAECLLLLQRILGTFTCESISSAVYCLMQAKETALNACKASTDTHPVEINIHHLEISCVQASRKVILKPKLPVRTQSMTLFPVVSPECTRHENEMYSESAGSAARPADQEPGCQEPPVNGSRATRLLSCFSTPPTVVPSTGQPAIVPCQRPTKAAPWHPGTSHIAQRHSSRGLLIDSSAGLCCRGSCCQILTSLRETIVICMTEGCLNNILDNLQSQRLLARGDYELIASYPTLTSRARALLDTCLCLGETVSHAVVTVLMSNKCSPLGIQLLQTSLLQRNQKACCAQTTQLPLS